MISRYVVRLLLRVLMVWLSLSAALCYHAVLATPLPLPRTHHVLARTVHLHTGSLQAQLTLIARSWGWSELIWASAHDFHWQGDTHIQTKSLFDLLSQVLTHYPLQAVFYQGNHVLVITPRELRS